MTSAARRFSLPSLPLWGKLLTAFLLAILLPLALSFSVIEPTLRDFGLQNLQSYISENGERQRQVIVNELRQARANLTTFLNDDAYNRRITGVLLRDSPLISSSQLQRVDPSEISALFRTLLLNRSTTLYESVRLLNRSGRLVTQATLGAPNAGISVPDQSRLAAYRAALEEENRQGRADQVIAVSNLGVMPLVEVVNVIRWRDGRPIGYLVAQVSNERVFLEALQFNDASYPAYSFLLTADGVFITPDDTETQATLAQESSAVNRALAGAIGVDIYQTSAGQEVTGYFAPLPETPLVLIAEVPTLAAASPGQLLFDTRALLIVAVSIAFAVLLVLFFSRNLGVPLHRLQQALEGISAGDFRQPLPDMHRADEVGHIATALAEMRERIQTLIEDLESRIAARTRDINTTQEISRYAATQRDLESLLNTVVNLIVERFEPIYHAQIFLLDSDRRYALLRSSTGEVGQTLLARGHRLAVGSVSVIGQVTEQGRVVIARDTAVSQVHRRNEFLPNTRAELAIPLRVGNQIIGALDVQSIQRDAFSDDLVTVLQTMADQLAIAIENARLYEESVRRLEEIERSNQQAGLRAWQEYMRAQRAQMLSSETGVNTPVNDSLRESALLLGQLAVGGVTERQTVPIAVPIILRGQILGVVEWELPASDLDQNRLQLAQELANRLGVSLENARLFEESQRATERERVVNTIAARLTTQTDINEILQTAVREVGQALRAPQVSIRLRRVEEAVPSPDSLPSADPSERVSENYLKNGANGSNGLHAQDANPHAASHE